MASADPQRQQHAQGRKRASFILRGCLRGPGAPGAGTVGSAPAAGPDLPPPPGEERASEPASPGPSGKCPGGAHASPGPPFQILRGGLYAVKGGVGLSR